MDNQEMAKPIWFWQDFVSTYRFWGLVFASFLMNFSSTASMVFLPTFLRDEGFLDISQIGTLYSVRAFGSLIGALLVLYFLRHRLKLGLIIFASMWATASVMMFSGTVTALPVLAILSIFMSLGTMGFMIAVVAVIVSGRPNLKSFIIAYSIVMLWNMMANFLSPVVIGLVLEYGLGWLVPAPALFAILALVLMSGKMFSGAPETHQESKLGPKRHPFVVFLFSAFVPFYYLVWIFKRPAELKALASDVKQPSRGGALMTALFAPYVLPIWFHNVRDDLGHKIPNRSAALIGIAAFLFPAIAAAMAQSDNNVVTSLDE